MTPFALLLGIILWILMPASAVGAAILAWFAFRRSALNGQAVGIAMALLVTPFILLAVIDEDGVDTAFSDYAPWQLSVLVGTSIVIALVRRMRRDQ